MSETIENYAPQVAANPAAIKTGRNVWLVLFSLSAIWLALIVAAPLLKQAHLTNISSILYYTFSFICHQLPGRSFHLGPDILAVCARCLGVYVGVFLGFLFYPLFRSVNSIEPL